MTISVRTVRPWRGRMGAGLRRGDGGRSEGKAYAQRFERVFAYIERPVSGQKQPHLSYCLRRSDTVEPEAYRFDICGEVIGPAQELPGDDGR